MKELIKEISEFQMMGGNEANWYGYDLAKKEILELLENHELTCDHRYFARNGRYMLYEDFCEKCGATDINDC